MKQLFLILISCAISFSLLADDSTLEDQFLILDEDSLFGFTEEEAVIEEEQEQSVLEAMEEDNLGVVIGGRVDSQLDSLWAWNTQPWQIDQWASESRWNPGLNLDLFVDARPDEDFRVYGKVKADYPFEEGEGQVRIHELFSDFNYNDRVFFRMGKQTINWNVGMLYSPAAILNIDPVNPQDLQMELEGPLALKTQMPMANSTLYLYTVANEIDDPREISWAPKFEYLLGNWELGIGGFYNAELTPKGALFLTGPLGPVDFLGEALIQNGSDRLFFTDNSPQPKERDELMVSATGGFMYRNEDQRLLLLAQYCYDQEAQSFEDLDLEGLHFAGFHGSKTFMLNEESESSQELNLSMLWLGCLSDQSGLIKPQIEWIPFDHAALAVYGNFYYGSEQSYYRFRGASSAPASELALSLRLGYGAF